MATIPTTVFHRSLSYEPVIVQSAKGTHLHLKDGTRYRTDKLVKGHYSRVHRSSFLFGMQAEQSWTAAEEPPLSASVTRIPEY